MLSTIRFLILFLQVHPQVTLRNRSRGVVIAGTTRCTRYTSLTCLICKILVYRVYQVVPLDIEGKDGPQLPTDEWVEEEIMKSPSGWIEIHQECRVSFIHVNCALRYESAGRPYSWCWMLSAFAFSQTRVCIDDVIAEPPYCFILLSLFTGRYAHVHITTTRRATPLFRQSIPQHTRPHSPSFFRPRHFYHHHAPSPILMIISPIFLEHHHHIPLLPLCPIFPISGHFSPQLLSHRRIQSSLTFHPLLLTNPRDFDQQLKNISLKKYESKLPKSLRGRLSLGATWRFYGRSLERASVRSSRKKLRTVVDL